MPSVKIDNIDYDLDTLSEEAKAQLESIRFVDQELGRLQARSAICKTARKAYIKALKDTLPASIMPSESIKLN